MYALEEKVVTFKAADYFYDADNDPMKFEMDFPEWIICTDDSQASGLVFQINALAEHRKNEA